MQTGLNEVSFSLNSHIPTRSPRQTPIKGLRKGTVSPESPPAQHRSEMYIRRQVGTRPPTKASQHIVHRYFQLDEDHRITPKERFSQAQVEIRRVVDRLHKTAEESLKSCEQCVPYKARPPEIIEIERKRALLARYLSAEEEKIRMECTPELVDGVHRRFLPTTIGRRHPLISCDIQDSCNIQSGLEGLAASRRTMSESHALITRELARHYATASTGGVLDSHSNSL
ncbi:hypothetical protein GMRT_10289 [Giardia muris]|uniref:Uncharacterized protein n=1 Tax=Giardia muris TaxID=5742 RepID=A0A4Z1SVR6_GIAMU|nr:hypothetical protein GMRT_10289 [Giardia muris]|eukprot:TNJ29864.1 hypothetical protein GMRT_10289 [Giardia muris]